MKFERKVGADVAEVLETLYTWLAFLPRITKYNLLEIVIIAFLVYEVLAWIKNSRAWTLLKGIVVILVFSFCAYVLKLNTILWMLEKTALIAATALIIIFQPELRKALEQLGSKNILTDFLSFDDKGNTGFTEKTANELVRATFEMGKVKTGALIVIEQELSLKEIERTGIEINGLVSSQLLINIFEHNTPLHDGAVVIRGNRIAAATCYLPLSDNNLISKDLGTRHRAAMGVSETTDSITIVVSEETGKITLARDGVLTRINDAETLRSALAGAKKGEQGSSRFKIWKGRQKDEGKADK